MSKALQIQKGDKIYLYAAYAIGVLFILSGAMKLIGQADPKAMFTEQFKFPLWLMYLTGVGEVLGGALLFVRQLRMPASFTLALIMVGATVTHIATNSLGMILITLPFMLVCLAIFVHRYRQLIQELAAEINDKK